MQCLNINVFTFKYKNINGKLILTFCEGELLDRLGFLPEKVVGHALDDFLSAEVAEEKRSFYEKAWNGQENVTYGTLFNGIYYLTSLSPIKQEGNVIEVIGFCIDITKWKETEKTLTEQKEIYRLIDENMNDLIAIFDLDGKVLYMSPSHEPVLGHPIHDYESKYYMSELHPDDQAMYSVLFEETIKSKQRCQLEFRLSGPDSGWMLFEAMLTPILDENGCVQKIISVARNITEKRQAEELLWKYEKLTAVGELAAGVAHEIRNPITTIRGFFQLFQQGIIEKEFFDVIFTEFNRIEETLNEFLTLAKPQAIEMRPIYVENLLNEVKLLLEPEANLKNVQIDHNLEKGSYEILGNPNQLKQVFINIMKNSMEAMPNGGCIRIKVHCKTPHLFIEFIDNGFGISEDRIPYLGEPFFSNKEKGTGLGLMICYKTLKEHHGKIDFKSKENHGTTVEVRLPLHY